MAGVLRIGVIVGGLSKTKPLAKANVPALVQVCGISGKVLRGLNKTEKPAPYPYKTKEYNVWTAFIDKTSKRFDDNSKVNSFSINSHLIKLILFQLICVEGPIAAGKSNFAKELAAELDMMYMPAASLDDIYINDYGFDLRTLDHKLPEGAKSFDSRRFCLEPNNRLVGQFQIRMYMLKMIKYADALAHILSTGQGVVCNRSPYSDTVFLEAMYRNNYISKGVRSVYHDVRNHTLPELMRPHLVIYLDVPVSKVKENIKKRNLTHEVKNKALTDQYLTDIEINYKQQYLKDISNHAELLVYDWSDGGETEVVVEDIERIDFDNFGHYDEKMKDWRIMTEWEWCEKRMEYTCDKADLIHYCNIPRYDVPELILTADDSEVLEEVYGEAPGMVYAPGFNSSMGDSGILTKTKQPFNYRN